MAKNTPAKDPRKGDDRNLVIVDQDFGQPDLEDRMWLFWLRNRVLILSFLALIIAAILGYIAFLAGKEYSLRSLQDEYQTVGEKPDEKLFFARAHANTPLAGVAALEAADKLYEEKDYAGAAGTYAEARKNFDVKNSFEAMFAGRALSGEAFARIYAGEREKGAELLDLLAKNPAYPNAFRGQAGYSLALLAYEKNDLDGARNRLDSMSRELGGNNPWLLKVSRLLADIPALSKPEPVPAVGEPAPEPAPEKSADSQAK